MDTSGFEPIVIKENVWRNTYLSVAKYSGTVKVGKYRWVMVDKRGKDIFECSEEANAKGRKYAIEPGEPCDLCRTDFVRLYRKLGREKFLIFLADNPDVKTATAAKERLKTWQK